MNNPGQKSSLIPATKTLAKAVDRIGTVHAGDACLGGHWLRHGAYAKLSLHLPIPIKLLKNNT